jgi:hypothetical protein
VTALGRHNLAVDSGKNGFEGTPESEENRNGDDGKKSQDQGVLDECLAFSGSLLPAKLCFRIHENCSAFDLKSDPYLR